MSGTINENATYYATVDHAGKPEGIECACANCDWKGAASDLNEIKDACLTPGDPSPAGRCPSCDSLAYVDKAGPRELAEMLRSVLNCAELNQDDLEPNTITTVGLAYAMLEDYP